MLSDLSADRTPTATTSSTSLVQSSGLLVPLIQADTQSRTSTQSTTQTQTQPTTQPSVLVQPANQLVIDQAIINEAQRADGTAPSPGMQADYQAGEYETPAYPNEALPYPGSEQPPGYGVLPVQPALTPPGYTKIGNSVYPTWWFWAGAGVLGVGLLVALLRR